MKKIVYILAAIPLTSCSTLGLSNSHSSVTGNSSISSSVTENSSISSSSSAEEHIYTKQDLISYLKSHNNISRKNCYGISKKTQSDKSDITKTFYYDESASLFKATYTGFSYVGDTTFMPLGVAEFPWGSFVAASLYAQLAESEKDSYGNSKVVGGLRIDYTSIKLLGCPNLGDCSYKVSNNTYKSNYDETMATTMCKAYIKAAVDYANSVSTAVHETLTLW